MSTKKKWATIDPNEVLRRIEILKKSVEKLIANDGKAPGWTYRRPFESLAELFTEFEPVSKVVVFKEKHGDLMYDASTKTKLWMAAYEVFVERNQAEYWYSHYTGEVEADPEEPKTPLEDAEFAEPPIAEAIKSMWNSYECEKKGLVVMREACELYQRALASDGTDRAALRFLEYQSGGEYERFEIETLCTVDRKLI